MASIDISSGISPTAARTAMAPARSPSPLPEVSSIAVANGVSSRGETSDVIDTFSIQNKVRKKGSPVDKEINGDNRKNALQTVNSILFSYNNKGNLRIRFMDSKSQLVYQTPPELFSHLSDIMMTPRTSVNTTV